MDDLQKTIKALPHTPGVYIYLDVDKKVIYVGKAKNLYKRVSSYFSSPRTLPTKTRQLISNVASMRIQQVGNEFDALLLEAKLIRHYNPKYNMIAKDDKSPIYIHISKNDRLPRVLLSRKPKNAQTGDGEYFGPFANKKTALSILRALRRSVPFCQQKMRNGKPCFYTHLGLCRPCPSVIEYAEEHKEELTKLYRTNITRLRWILSCQSQKTLISMQEDMRKYAREDNFEKAAELRDQIQMLISIQKKKYDPFLFEEMDTLEKNPAEEGAQLCRLLSPYFPSMNILERIECFDISTMQGSASVGSMVVFQEGIPSTDQYRKFKIRDTQGLSDTAMMEETVRRRLSHTEWPFPNLIVIDGGKGQVAVIQTLIRNLQLEIPIIGLAKRFEQIIIKSETDFKTLTVPASSPALQLLERIRDEAHRFAISYHRQRRSVLFAH